MVSNVFRRIEGSLSPAGLSGRDAQHLVARTYYTMRWGLGGLAAIFPFVLLIGEHLVHGPPLPHSISGYYHTTAMRTVWTGVLVLLGAFLVLYKGFSKLESVLLNVAGIGVLLVVTCPCVRDEGATDPVSSYTYPAGHGVGAAAAFGGMAIVAIFLSSNTLHLIEDARVRRTLHVIYVALGIAMIVLPALSWLLLAHDVHWMFWVETAAVEVFALYWLVKTWEFKRSDAETRALAGTLPTSSGRA